MITKKRILSVVITAAIIIGAVAGIGTAVKATTQNDTVIVVPVSDLNYGGGYYNENTVDGMVSTDASQDFYLTNAETVQEVKVKEGQKVKEGDVLLVLDTRKTSLGLEQEKINHQRIELNIEVAKKNLETLNKLKPVSSTDGGDGYDPVLPDDMDSVDVDDNSDAGNDNGADSENDQVWEKIITSEAVDAYAGDGDGSAAHPFVFCVQPDADGQMTIDPSFITALQDKRIDMEEAGSETDGSHIYFCLRQLDESGVLSCAWIGDAMRLRTDAAVKISMTPGVSSDQLTASEIASILSGMDLSDADREAIWKASGIDIVTPTPTPTAAPETTPVPTTAPEEPTPTPTTAPETTPAPTTAPEETTPTPDPAEASPVASGSTTGSGNTTAYSTLSGGSTNGEGTQNPAVTGRIVTAVAIAPLDKAASVSLVSSGGLSGTASMDTGTTGEDTSSGTGSSADIGLIPSNAEYTADELNKAKEDEQKKLDDLNLDLQESDLKIAKTEKDLSAGTIVAKMDGVVKKVSDPDNPPTDGSAFLTVTGSEGLYITGAIAENRMRSVHEGDVVEVTSWTTGNSYEATIKSISPYPDTSGSYSYDTTNSYYPFTAYIDTKDAQLENGEYLQIRFLSATDETEETDGALYLSRAFIREEGGQRYVWKRGSDGKLVQQMITVGSLTGDSYEIKDGITADDWIAFPYGSGIKEGAKTKEGTLDDLYNA